MKEYMYIVFRRKGVFALTVMLIMGAVLIGLQLKTPLYEAQVTMLIQARKNIASPYYEKIRDADSVALTATQSEIVTSNPVIERAVNRLRLVETAADYEKQFASALKVFFIDLRHKIAGSVSQKSIHATSDQIKFRKAVEDLKERVEVSPVPDTNLFTISVSDYSPFMAVRIANMVSRSYSIFDLEQQLSELKQKYGEKHLFVKQLKDNIALIAHGEAADEVSNIEAIGPASVKVIEQATVPLNPTGVSDMIILCLAFVVSIACGYVSAFFADNCDVTFRSPGDVTASLPLPLIGYIPRRGSPVAGGIKIIRFAIRLVACVVGLSFLIELLGVWSGVSADNQVLVCARQCSARMFFLFSNGSVHELGAAGYTALVVITLIVSFVLIKIASWQIRGIQRRIPLVKNPQNNSLGTKSYSDLSDELYRLLHACDRRAAVVAHVSSGHQTGAIVANLGMSLSQKKGYRVLLIEAHPGSPSYASLFALRNKRGLLDMLRDDAAVSVSFDEVSPGLFVLPFGAAGSNGESLLRQPSFDAFIRKAEKEYDIVLISCAAVSESQDVSFLASLTAGAVVVVDEQATKRDVAKAQVEALRSKDVPLLGVILHNRTFVIPKLIYEIT